MKEIKIGRLILVFSLGFCAWGEFWQDRDCGTAPETNRTIYHLASLCIIEREGRKIFQLVFLQMHFNFAMAIKPKQVVSEVAK